MVKEKSRPDKISKVYYLGKYQKRLKISIQVLLGWL